MQKLSNLPHKLQETGLFCLWKYEEQTNKNGNKRLTKVPYNPNQPASRASSTDRTTFAPLDVAKQAFDDTSFNGLGIGIFDGITAIDIDHCYNEDSKLKSTMAEDIMRIMHCYTEISPSGTGLRLIFFASLDYDTEKYYINNQKLGLEVYVAGQTNKYVTVTGNALQMGDLEERTEELKRVLDKYMVREASTTPQPMQRMPIEPSNLSDSELLEKARNAKNGSNFASLWDGDFSGYASQSEADQALCNHLAFWTGCDEGRMQELFLQSGLNRINGGKYKSQNHYLKYLNRTIKKAIASCGEVYSPTMPQEAPKFDFKDFKGAGDEIPTPEDKAPQKGAETPTDPFIQFCKDIQTEKYKPIKTGMPAFDSLLGGGILKQSLVVLTAAPGAGKTSFASQIFEDAAASGTDVVFLNLEMSEQQLFARSLSRIIHRQGHRMTAADVLKGYAWTDEQRKFVKDAAEEYRTRIHPHMRYNLNSDNSIDSIYQVLNEIGQKAKQEGKQAPIVVLDYLHLITAGNRQIEGQELIKQSVAMLKGYALTFETFVFCIGANNRIANGSGNITLESGRDSSAIEYSADYQIALNYAALQDKDKISYTDQKGKFHENEQAKASNPDHMSYLQDQKPREMVVQILKNRMNAAGGKLYLYFDSASNIFYPMEGRRKIPTSIDDFQTVDDADENDNPFLKDDD